MDPDVPLGSSYVSPQDRVPVRWAIEQRIFGCEQVFIGATTLCGVAGTYRQKDVQRVAYWHILCRGHNVIFANDMRVETLFTGPEALRGQTNDHANLPRKTGQFERNPLSHAARAASVQTARATCQKPQALVRRSTYTPDNST